MTHQGDAVVVSAAVKCRREEPRAAAEEVMHSGYRTKFRIESAKVKVGEIDPTQKRVGMLSTEREKGFWQIRSVRMTLYMRRHSAAPGPRQHLSDLPHPTPLCVRGMRRNGSHLVVPVQAAAVVGAAADVAAQERRQRRQQGVSPS